MSSPLLDSLNDAQREAVLHESGPVLIFAGAGSGKTNALTKRIAYLIQERDIRPYNILAVTFTNKAAAEMKERIANLVGDTAMRDLWAGTFHSLCARCLRERGSQIGLDKNFSIYDDGDQLALVKESLRELDLDDKRFAPRAVLGLISKAKETLQTPKDIQDDFTASPFERAIGQVYQLYEEKLALSNALDFDDLIMKTVQLLRESERARAHYQNRFQFVHCDEFQDVNDSQYQLLTLFAGKHKNICVVGDDDQCVVEGTPILTPSGYVPVESVKEGDTILAACGAECLAPAVVDNVSANDYAGPIRHIQTEHGATVRVTPNHILFKSLPTYGRGEVSPEVPYEVVSRKPIYGYYDEGLRKLLSRSEISFSMLRDTEISEYGVHPYFEVHRFAGNGNTCTARFDDYDEAWAFAKYLQQRHFVAGINVSAYVGRGYVADYAEVLTCWHLLPVVSLVPEPKVGDSRICAISDEDYTGKVYDLSVANLRNYVAGGIVVHNSIYAFRGANVQIILNFERDFPDARIIKLEQNYRSTKTILDAAYHVVRNNRGRADKRLWTENVDGEQLTLLETPNEVEEAAAVVNVVREGTIGGDRRYSDFAVLYRANSQSRAMEEQFLNYRIPYKIVGGVRFYERREIKDVLAYLRVLQNPYDSVSLRRIINVPTRAIGVSTIEKIANFAARSEIAFWDACRRVQEIDLPSRARHSVAAFVKAMEYLRTQVERQSVSDLVQNVLDTTGYLDDLRKENTPDAQSRADNVGELLSVAKAFEAQAGDDGDKSLTAYLEHVSLVSDLDTLEDTANSVTLMTLHAAKGLEFPVVFLVGLEEGVFPHIRAMGDQSELEEERRLCYVGITRAREDLYLSYAGSRMLFGQVQRNPVSRFVSEIPMSLFLAKSSRRGAARDYVPTLTDGSRRPQSTTAPRWEELAQATSRKAARAPAPQPFAPGERVRHSVFGEGFVIAYEDTLIKVQFLGAHGLKKLDLAFAKLEKA